MRVRGLETGFFRVSVRDRVRITIIDRFRVMVRNRVTFMVRVWVRDNLVQGFG